MGGSVGVGFIAVFAVSGSVVLLVHQVHKRLLSDFMKKVESELGTHHHAVHSKKVESQMGSILYAHTTKNKFNGSGKCQVKKKVRFADDVKEPSSNNKEYRQKQGLKHTMPPNRQALYKGVIENTTHKEQYV